MAYDSSMAGDAKVEHTTSWLTINPVKGCSLGCAYCFRARWHPDAKPSVQYDVSEAIDELVRHPHFIPHETPVSINVSSTDAMLPSVRPITRRAIELLDQRGLRNPLGLTTKLRIPDQFLEFLTQLNFLRPIVFVSLAMLPKKIEPPPCRPRIENLKRLNEARVPSVLYYRPIIEGLNDSPQTIEQLLRIGDRHCEAICIGGLRVSPEIEAAMRETGLDLPAPKTRGFHEKLLPESIERTINSVHRDLGLKVPVYRHTSCAVSKVIAHPNYNALYEDAANNCASTCPAAQEAICHGR
jgi:DNA repair photolyase